MPKNNWFVVEEADITHCLFAASPIEELTSRMEEIGFSSLQFSGTEYLNTGGNYVFVEKEWMDKGKEYLEIIKKDPSTLEKINEEASSFGKELFEFGDFLLKENFESKTNIELHDLYEKFEFLHEEAHLRRGPIWILETADQAFSNHLTALLSKRIKEQKLDLNPDIIFSQVSSLSTKNQASLEKEDFLKIALELKKSKKIDEKIIKDKLVDHHKKYCWLPYGITGPAWDIDYFVDEMNKILGDSIDEIESQLNKSKEDFVKIQKEKEEILSLLKLSEIDFRLIKLAESSVEMKAYTKDALFFGYYCAEKLFRKIAERLGIEMRLLYHLFPWEILELLKNNQKADKELLEGRADYSFHFVEKGNSKMLVRQEAKDFVASIDLKRSETIDDNIDIIKGTCAMRGQGKGTVKIINLPEEVDKMNEGDVLVSKMTDPQIVVAMKKASAIVTDMGGITCHAAIVSRELGIPCVIGTKIASQVLKDGDEVEVDADNGVIKKI